MTFEEACEYIAQFSAFSQLAYALIEEGKLVHRGNPEAIQSLADGWKSVSKTIIDNENGVTTAVTRAMDDWEGDAADNFVTYMGDLQDVLGRHSTKADDIRGHLQDAKDAIEDARKAAEEATDTTTKRLGDVLLAASGGGAAGAAGVAVTTTAAAAVTAAALSGAAIAAIVAILADGYNTLHGLRQAREDRVIGVRDAMLQLLGVLERDEAKEFEGPPEPTIVTAPSFSSEEFYSEHQPPELDGVTVSTTPPEKPAPTPSRGQMGQAPN
ncbi:MAG: hypothetical protein GEV03_02385 [Streptosporangiales bacterium]|nr:hypothetical protein [Streptosporangiales bacterium]